MITIFSAPKAMTGDADRIQRNAIGSWIRLDPDAQGGRPMSAGGTNGAGVTPAPGSGGTATAVSTVRSVTRGTGREPGRY